MKKFNIFLQGKKIIFSFTILSIILTGIIIPNKSVAKSSNNSNSRWIYNKSKAFENWENLPDDERKLEFQPQYSDLSIKNSMKRSTYNILLNKNSSLESTYNIDKSKITVKNQQKVGSCWAFAMTSMLETNFIKKYNKNPILYSPMHMEYKTYDMYNRELGVGGNYNLAMSYMADGYGPVYEKDFPMENVYNEETNSKEQYYLTDPSKVNTDVEARARLKDSVTFSTILKNYSDNNVTYTNGNTAYTDAEVSAIRKKIKEHIKDYGAVVALFYCDMGIVSPDSTEIKSDYYNNENNSYYCNDSSAGANHALTIIGWDDNFSKDNFGAEENAIKPIHDGAYIVLNSWGDELHDNGYFYVSYDDASIESGIQGVVDIDDFSCEPEASKSYDYIYQYDELGYSVPLGSAGLSSLYGANVFSKQNLEKNEYVTEVGIYVPITEGIEIYVNDDVSDLSGGELVASYTGSNAVEPGYHVFGLSSPIKINGDKFAIKVKFIQSETAAIPLECKLHTGGSDSLSSAETMFDKATSNSSESYVSTDGNVWDDLYNNPDFGPYASSNICVKAFTTLEENLPKIDVSGVSLNKSELTIEVGDVTNLEAKISPENATDKVVIWQSSNPEVVSVSSNGVITAKSEGKAIISVTTEDGNYSAECEVTVIAKKNTDDDIYNDNDEDKETDNNPEISGGTQTEEEDSSNENQQSVSDKIQSSNSEGMPTVLPQTGIGLSADEGLTNNVQKNDLVFLISVMVLIIGSLIFTITLFVKYKKIKNN